MDTSNEHEKKANTEAQYMDKTNELDSNPYAMPFARYYTLFLLTIVYIFNFIDRQILSILQEPIKRDLGLSDSQLGLLTGFAFAMFYVIAGIPMARLADQHNRRNIIAWSLGIWSAMTAVCGVAQTYTQLFLARIGVGIGEAGCSPPAHSMISDIFPPEKRASVLSIYTAGVYIGVLFGFLMGGWLNQFLGWRIALLFVGVPGIALALLVRFTIPEPLRGLSSSLRDHKQSVSLMQVYRLLWSRKSFRYLSAGGAFSAFAAYSVLNWMAPYLIRVHGMSTGELGTILALSIGLCGGLGTFASGMLADRLAKRDRRWYAWIPALAMFVSVPAYIAVFSMTSPSLILLINILPMFLSNTFTALSITMIHGMLAPTMRATGSALFLLIANIFGLGLGPWLVGIASDYLQPAYGHESIRYALLYIAPIIALIGGFLYWRAGKQLREDMENAPT
jgi:predicted MFS family arabinose efflux permease